MRHNKKRGMKLGTDASHTKAMKKSLIRALFENDRIKTLDVRAKAIRPEVDKVITWAKKGDIASRRLAIAKVGDKELVREVFEKAAQGMWADRNGGYTRIMKLGPRKGDPPRPLPRPRSPRSRLLPSRSPRPRRLPPRRPLRRTPSSAQLIAYVWGPGTAGALFGLVIADVGVRSH